MQSRRDREVVLQALIEKYVARVPRVRRANSIPSLVDILTRQVMFERPRLSYKEAMDLALADEDVLRAYADS